MNNSRYQYALMSPDGKYYTGRAGEGWLSDNKTDAFTYTEAGAKAKIENHLFSNFSVVRVPTVWFTVE